MNMNATLQGRLIIGKCWTVNLRDKAMLGFVGFVAVALTPNCAAFTSGYTVKGRYDVSH